MSDSMSGDRRSFYGSRTGRYQAALKYLFLTISTSKRRSFNGAHFLLATEGSSFERSFSTFRLTSAGSRLLQTMPASLAILQDRQAMLKSPAGSLADCYARFMVSNGFDERLYARMSTYTRTWHGTDYQRSWYRARTECTHDLRHVIIGYGPDPLGELCLQSFRFGQLRHFGMLTLATLGFLHPELRRKRVDAFRAMREAYRRGRAAKLVDILPWEETLDGPLSEHRALLGLTAPKHYDRQIEPDHFPKTG